MNIKRHIFNFISDHDARLNYVPTQSEIRKTFADLTADVDLHLEQLQREGLLELGKTGDESITVPHTFPPARRIELRGVPFPGTMTAGDPLAQNSVALDLRGAGVTLDGDLFAHVAGDDAMLDAGIASGDVAILKAASPERGDIVAVEEKGRLTLRRYIVVAGIPHFLAENPTRPDLTAAYEKPIHGVLWCLICTRPSGRGKLIPPIKKVNYRRDGGLTLESEFVALLKSELKKNPRVGASQNVRATFSKPQEKEAKSETTSGRRLVGSDRDWPKPPSGTSLNDKAKPEYRGTRRRSLCDEKPDRAYGEDFDRSLSRLASNEHDFSTGES